jgi:two-component system phosphate regulon response regulator PhoB
MNKPGILVVEDEEDILELVAYNLTREGYPVTGVTSGEALFEKLGAELPGLIVLDLMLPGMDGLEVCRRLKQEPRTRALPVLMLTAKGEEADIVAGLELGADDYVPKPFSPRVLLARVRAVLRRSAAVEEPNGGAVSLRGLSIVPGRQEAVADGTPLDLTYTEFHILYLLARRPGWVFTRGQIVAAVRGGDYHVTERAVDVQIAGLRKKLGRRGEDIETVRGVGYRYRE